ncbi:MAG: DM13 domain-containing protein [Cyanobacteria bacterium J06581_3]
MTLSPIQQIKRIGLTVAIAAFAYQPAMQANTSARSVLIPSPTIPMVDTASTLVAAAPVELSTNNKQLGAAFVGADGHSTSGGVQIVEENGQRYLELDSSFRTDSGPDLFVLLHRDAVPGSYNSDDYVNLGRVQSFNGAQRYAIPADVDLSAFQSAVIWCQDFDVTFGYATI